MRNFDADASEATAAAVSSRSSPVTVAVTRTVKSTRPAPLASSCAFFLAIATSRAARAVTFFDMPAAAAAAAGAAASLQGDETLVSGD